MKLLFLCLSNLKFDVETPLKEPLGGTESAISYLSTELATLGHDVTLMSNMDAPKTLRGVKHIPINENLVPYDPDVVIVTSAPQAIPAIRGIVPRAKVVLWNHMQPDQPAMQAFFDPAVMKHIKHIVYVSEAQKDAFVARVKPWPKDKGQPPIINERVIQNAIAPCFENRFSSSKEILETKKCRGVYTSTPYRGLAILSKIHEMEIDVFSSMKVYQADDKPFEAMYNNLKANDCLKLNGSVSQTELADKLRPIAFFVYPSIFAECHSIAILEAMAMGLKIITTDMASPQTAFIDSMPNGGSVDDYARMLRKNINFYRSQTEVWAEQMWQQVQYINREFIWSKRAQEWTDYLSEIVRGVDDSDNSPQV